MEFLRQYQEKVYNVQRNGQDEQGELLTEQAGYVSTKNLVEEMTMAGERYNAYREEQYDFAPEKQPNTQQVDEDYYDPTRSPGFDAVDAERHIERLNENFREAKHEGLAKRLAENAKKQKDNAVEKSRQSTAGSTGTTDKGVPKEPEE